jgi:hypothetical protein
MNSVVQGTETDLVRTQIVLHKGDKIITPEGEFVAEKDMTVIDLAELGVSQT